jgi:hypothetical protein
VSLACQSPEPLVVADFTIDEAA